MYVYFNMIFISYHVELQNIGPLNLILACKFFFWAPVKEDENGKKWKIMGNYLMG
jgi:hypothetical protein